jgi:hypothetical protein
MKLTALFSPLLFSVMAAAQTTAIFPDEYVDVAEGPNNSPNLPFSRGTSRVQCLYEAIDLAIPSGQQITQLGFRQDATTTALDTGRTLQLEIRMGFSTHTAASLTTNFANNYATTPVTVFGPATFVLPNLRDTASPLPNGQFFVPLTTPFAYVPAGNNLVVEYLVYGNSGGGTQWNYRLDRADFHSPRTYGPAGCPRSGGGTPNLTVQPVRPGQTYSTSCSSAPGSSFGYLLIAPGQQLVAPFSLQSLVPGIAPACTGQVGLGGVIQLSGVTGTTGSINWSFAIPNTTAFNDFYWASQGAFFDFFAPGGVVVSNGAELKTGVNPRSSILAGNGPPLSLTTGSVSRNYCPVAFFVHQ